MKLIEDLGVISFGKYRKRAGMYECPDCFKHFKSRTGDVKNGKTLRCKSCSTIVKNTTHNKTNTPLHNRWCAIISRTNTHVNYKGRGISICPEWKSDFSTFEKWALASGFKNSLEIDRIDNDGNYEPSNCRWVSSKVNCNNKRNSVYSNLSNETISKVLQRYKECGNKSLIGRELKLGRRVIGRIVNGGEY